MVIKLIAAALAVLGLSGLWFRRRATGPVPRRRTGAAATITASAALCAAGLLAGYAWLTSPPREPRTATLAPPPGAAETTETPPTAPGGSPVGEDAGASSTPERREEEPPAKPADPDAPLRRLVVGTWEDHYQGKRTMTLKADGTGTMLVELSGLSAILFADCLRFDMAWSLEQGRLKKQTIGGEPADKVELILKTMGDRVDERILELTDQRLLLLDGNGQTQYDWQRVPAPGATGKPSADDADGTATKDTSEHVKIPARPQTANPSPDQAEGTATKNTKEHEEGG